MLISPTIVPPGVLIVLSPVTKANVAENPAAVEDVTAVKVICICDPALISNGGLRLPQYRYGCPAPRSIATLSTSSHLRISVAPPINEHETKNFELRFSK
jgi:hypothetical protein